MERERYCRDISSESGKPESRIGFNSSEVPKREAIRCETNGDIDAKDARNVGRIGFALRSELKLLHLRFNDALINWEMKSAKLIVLNDVQQNFLYLLSCLLLTDNFEPFFKCRI